MSAGSTTERVSLEEVKHVADLANLELTAEELPGMALNLNAILGYVEQLRELDIAEVPPMAQPAELLRAAQSGFGEGLSEFGEGLRADAVRPSVDRAAVMAEAPESDSRFFKVPKVIER